MQLLVVLGLRGVAQYGSSGALPPDSKPYPADEPGSSTCNYSLVLVYSSTVVSASFCFGCGVVLLFGRVWSLVSGFARGVLAGQLEVLYGISCRKDCGGLGNGRLNSRNTTTKMEQQERAALRIPSPKTPKTRRRRVCLLPCQYLRPLHPKALHESALPWLWTLTPQCCALPAPTRTWKRPLASQIKAL